MSDVLLYDGHIPERRILMTVHVHVPAPRRAAVSVQGNLARKEQPLPLGPPKGYTKARCRVPWGCDSLPQKALRGGIPCSFLEPFARSWSYFVGIYRQKLARSLGN
jgi:hypothetical protein